MTCICLLVSTPEVHGRASAGIDVLESSSFILFYSLLLSLQEFDGRILPGKSCKIKSIRFCSPIGLLLDHGKD